MSKAEKDAEIVANRDKKPGRGKKFPVELSEKVTSLVVICGYVVIFMDVLF